MQTLSYAAFRRKIKPNTVVKITNRRFPRLDRTATVIKAQGNAFTTHALDLSGKQVESWITWPKASDVRVDDGVCHLLENGSPWLSIEVVG